LPRRRRPPLPSPRTSALTVKDRAVLPGTSQNISVVFTAEGGNDAPFLASPLEAQAPWTTAFNQLLYAYYSGARNAAALARDAAAAVDSSYYYTAYINNVERLNSPDLLPKRRYLELTPHGKHLASASAGPYWADALAADLADAFDVNVDNGLHVTLTASASSGVNNSTFSVRFSVKPLLNVAVNRTTFFATNGTRKRERHPAPTNAPGSVTNAPGSVTNAPGDAAPGVTTAAVFVAATALVTAMSLF
jgi:hypothetical protein